MVRVEVRVWIRVRVGVRVRVKARVYKHEEPTFDLAASFATYDLRAY